MLTTPTQSPYGTALSRSLNRFDAQSGHAHQNLKPASVSLRRAPCAVNPVDMAPQLLTPTSATCPPSDFQPQSMYPHPTVMAHMPPLHNAHLIPPVPSTYAPFALAPSYTAPIPPAPLSMVSQPPAPAAAAAASASHELNAFAAIGGQPGPHPGEIKFVQPNVLEKSQLFGVACTIIEHVWPDHGRPRSNVCSLTTFVQSIYERSRLENPVLELALYYIFHARLAIAKRIAVAREMQANGQTPPKHNHSHNHNNNNTNSSDSTASSTNSVSEPAAAPSHTASTLDNTTTTTAEQDQPRQENTPPVTPPEKKCNDKSCKSNNGRGNGGCCLPDPSTCGRRMFLAAMIVASKFALDKTYTNRAWSRLSCLDVKEVVHLENVFLELIDYNANVKPEVFAKWCTVLGQHAEANAKAQRDAEARAAAGEPVSPPSEPADIPEPVIVTPVPSQKVAIPIAAPSAAAAAIVSILNKHNPMAPTPSTGLLTPASSFTRHNSFSGPASQPSQGQFMAPVQASFVPYKRAPSPLGMNGSGYDRAESAACKRFQSGAGYIPSSAPLAANDNGAIHPFRRQSEMYVASQDATVTVPVTQQSVARPVTPVDFTPSASESPVSVMSIYTPEGTTIATTNTPVAVAIARPSHKRLPCSIVPSAAGSESSSINCSPMALTTPVPPKQMMLADTPSIFAAPKFEDNTRKIAQPHSLRARVLAAVAIATATSTAASASALAATATTIATTAESTSTAAIVA